MAVAQRNLLGADMTEKQAKKMLRKMRDHFTVGTILHFLSEIFRELADEARQDNDQSAFERHKNVESALFVTGLGVDAACPR